MRDIAKIRREYGELALQEQFISACPIEAFRKWLEDAYQSQEIDPTAMVLSTVDRQGWPNSRVVLLKGIEEEGFLFYTHYCSAKGRELALYPACALNFYWPILARQVRVRGRVQKSAATQSDAYFASRPRNSQLSVLAAPQSSSLSDRIFLEKAFALTKAQYENKTIARPATWGGYSVFPEELEFWQGRDSRLHDRIQYKRQQQGWARVRLAP